MEEENTNQLLLKMSDTTYRKLRLLAADIDISLNDLIIELIDKNYDSVEIDLPKKRVASFTEDPTSYSSMTQSMRLMRGGDKSAAESE
ncbi:MAG: hypothetical protein ABSG91_05295 [Syntrophobacteraceae bacterium]|jgi:hypothetical protein